LDTTPPAIDAGTVAWICQAISGELVLETLIDRILDVALEHGGAQRGMLLLLRDAELFIEALATAKPNVVEVCRGSQPASGALVPRSLLWHVARTRRTVVLGDGPEAWQPFLEDPYLQSRPVRSLVCLPLVRRRELLGVLYLENASGSDGFPRSRTALLEIVAAQAAISIENARLHAALGASQNDLKNALRESRSMVDAVPAFLWRARPDGSKEYLNLPWLEYTGLSSEQAAGSGWVAAFHPDDLPFVQQVWQQFRASGTAGECEVRLRRHDGEYRWFLVRVKPVHDENGNVVSWYGVNIDIEDLKRAQAALERNDALLAAGQRASATGTFSWRVADDDIRWTEELYRIFELPPNVPVTLELIATRVHPDDLALMGEFVERVHGGASDFEYGHRLLLPDGSVKHVHLVGHRTSEQELVYVGAAQDVTGHQLSEAALAKVRSELSSMTRLASMGALTAAIAHEVNQPLSGVMTNVGTCLRMLSATSPNVSGALETAQRALRDSQRARDVIARLRALFTKKSTSAEPVDLNEATREVLTLSLSELQRAGVVLRSELADALPCLIGDRIQLQQVILNLLLNASEAMSGVEGRPRCLVVRTERDDGDHLRLIVRDVGVGLPAHDAERVFQPLYTTKESGMGIGLSVSRSIVESHGGRLWAESNADDPGATFILSLPLNPPH
jgi:PAS domain S-box-containing protein